MLIRKKVNPELEEMRSRGLNNEEYKRRNIKEAANEMIESLGRIHVSFLLLPENQEALQKFCIVMSSMPAGILNNSWNALAVGLGFSRLQVECIKHTCREDFTHLVLKSYAVQPEAVIGKIIEVLQNIDRLDAFSAIRDELGDLAVKTKSSTDENASIVEGSSSATMRIIYPPDYFRIRAQLMSQLFVTIRPISKNCKESQTERREMERDCVLEHMRTMRISSEVQGASVMKQPKVTPKHNVFLTYTNDGAEVAKKIAKAFRTQSGNRPPIGVLILDEHVEKVQQNPERFIMHWFYKMNYVIPILTEGYMKAIAATEPTDFTSLDSLDNQYAQLIHDLSNKYYRSNNCLNDKIRCIVPLEGREILNHTHRKIDPIMKAYVYDKDVEELARRITRTLNDD